MKEITKNNYFNLLFERYKLECVIGSIESDIKARVKKDILKRFRPVKLFSEGIEFELLGVNTRYHSSTYNIIDEGVVAIELAYICISSVNKAKTERINKAKELYMKYPESPSLPWRKSSLWHTLRYEISIDEALSGNYDLNITL